VLPFANRSRDQEDEYFAEGLADELLNVLAKIRGLRVAARTSSSQFKGASEDVGAIGRKLNVATLLEGSVRKAGDRVRISVQLVKVSDGYHLWSETFDRTLEDIFAVQDDIAQSVVKELRAKLLGEEPDSKASGEVKAEVAAAAAGRGTNAEAHRLFLQGRYFVHRTGEEDMARGIGLLRQALAIEPENALAWATLSWAETLAAIIGNAPLDEGIERSREAAARSLALQPDLPEALIASGWIQLWYDFDWKGAEATFARAIELAPSNAEVLAARGMIAHLLGRHEEALASCRRSLEQDPLNILSYGQLGRIYLGMESLPEAEAAFRKTLEMSPEATSIRALLAFALLDQERLDEAMSVALSEPAEWARMWVLAVIHHRGGRPEESQRALDKLIESNAYNAAYQIAVAYAARGEVDQAFEWLERSYAQRDSGLVFMKAHAIMRPLHGDPRWKVFLAKMGFPD
jgi:TolB-like protein/Flp pilus assembly protein TadD